MEKYIIRSGNRVSGVVHISGSKNASLPILASSILTEGNFQIGNVPDLLDVKTMLNLLQELGLKCTFCKEKNIVNIQNNDVSNIVAPYELVKQMRASILVLAPLLSKRGIAKVSLPGGCAIGERPIDQHIKAFKLMGAEIEIEHGFINAKCDHLRGADIFFDMNTVTGTENIIMAAVRADGRTVIYNAAQEPEVVDLCVFLKKMGAKISGEGTKTIVIDGVSRLNPVDYTVMGDRIETGTFLCIVSAAGGELLIKDAPVKHIGTIVEKMAETGLNIKVVNDSTLKVNSNCNGVKSADITTGPYPGFPTDMQAPFMALMIKADGISVITECIFENRFMHIAEFKRMGADVVLKNRAAIVKGVDKLTGCDVSASDLRAGAGLILAALLSEGESRIHNICYIDRGYENFEDKLRKIGVDIVREERTEI